LRWDASPKGDFYIALDEITASFAVAALPVMEAFDGLTMTM